MNANKVSPLLQWWHALMCLLTFIKHLRGVIVIYLGHISTILRTVFSLFLFVYYSFGVICLPMGDFSTLVHLPEMYAHCKGTEDPDLNILDFVGEHLMNLDGIFEPHGEADDDDKPHEVVVFVSQNQIIPLNEAILAFEFKNNSPLIGFFSLEKIGFENLSYFYNPNFSIFRPPIDLKKFKSLRFGDYGFAFLSEKVFCVKKWRKSFSLKKIVNSI